MADPKLQPDLPFTFGWHTIALPVELLPLPKSIELGGETLLRKSAFHASLVCIEQIADRHGWDLAAIEPRIIELFLDFARRHDLTRVEFSGEFRLAESGELKSVVALCRVPNLAELFEQLSRELGAPIELQPAHVTIFTRQPDAGIFLTSLAEMAELSRPVSLPAELTRIFDGETRGS